jgi:DNA-binding transcriptional regulator PaaX
MSIVMEILEDLWNMELRYKGAKVNAFGVPIFWEKKKDHPQSSFSSTMSRLKKKGFVEIKSGKWILTENGKKYFDDKKKLTFRFVSPFVLNAPRNLLLMFDVPESKRAERNWLRWHLKEFQYYMIQQSVWVGPSPLPQKFKEHAKNMGLNKFVKTFKLAKPYQISKTRLTF